VPPLWLSHVGASSLEDRLEALFFKRYSDFKNSTKHSSISNYRNIIGVDTAQIPALII
jgi:hypothetical protein